VARAPKEGAQAPARLVHDAQLLGEVGAGDNLDAWRGERAQAADVVPVGMGHDHPPQRRVGVPAQVREGGARMLRCGPGIDGHQAIGGQDEGEVAEGVALGDVDAGRGLDQPGRHEVEAILGREPGVGRELAQLWVQGRIARALQRRACGLMASLR